MPHRLLESTQAVLDGQQLVEHLVQESERELEDLRDRRDEFLEQIHHEPQKDLLLPEVTAVLESFSLAEEWLESCQSHASSFDTEKLLAAWKDGPVVFQRLDFDFFRLHRTMWSVRGPFTHPGINRLLACETELEPMIQEEIVLQENTEQNWGDSGTWGQHCLDWSEDYLIALRQSHEPGWRGRLETLGQQFARMDLLGLARQYASGPTSYAWINLALHSLYLLHQGAVDVHLVEHIFDSAKEQLAATWESANSARSKLKQAQNAAEITDELLQWLEEGKGLCKSFKPEVYQAWCEDAVALGEELRSQVDG